MYSTHQLSWNVIIPAEKLEVEGLLLEKAIVIRLLEDFAFKKASKDLGYFMYVTTLEKIGEETLEGVVHKILKQGVFLRCGPTDKVFLSHQKMVDYKYVPGENPFFINEKMPRIKKGTVVRFIVVGARYVEEEKEFQVVVSLEGDYLGPVLKG
ncbi:DNA-directed RNA polymerase V subunit 7 [Capsicum chinense]|nr:DNA-directed RNA polymerase V subunit 7 [Capsicum chinense]